MSETIYGVVATEDVVGVQVLHCTPDLLIGIAEQIHSDGYVSCIDLTCVDYLSHPGRTDLPPKIQPQRFEVVATFISHSPPKRLRVRVQVPESNPQVPTLFDIYPSVEVLEREVFDMFGIVFESHPNMKRILMPDDWEGHPLRKDFSTGAVPVQFSHSKSDPQSREAEG